MSKSKSENEKKKRDFGDYAAFIMPVGFVLVAGSVGFWESCGHFVYGVTPAQLEEVSLEATPKQLAHALPASNAQKERVRVDFKIPSARPYLHADFEWSSDAPSAPESMRLIAAHPEHDDPHGAEVLAALSRRFHAIHSGEWRFGRVAFSVSKKDGEISFTIDPTHEKGPNPLFERQVDAARQVVLEAAFGIPVHASDADLADLLGTGYHTADVGKIDPQTNIEDLPASIATKFPGAIHDQSDSWEIAVDQPLLRSVSLRWNNQRGGTMSNAQIEVSDAYESSRELLQACLANKVGPPVTKVTDYAAAKKNYVFRIGTLVLTLERKSISLNAPVGWDASFWSQTFDALGGCADKSENLGGRGDGRKK